MTLSAVTSVLYFSAGAFFFLLGLTILRIGRASAPTRAAALMLFFAGLGPLLAAATLVLQNAPRAGTVVFGNMFQDFEYLWEFFFPSLFLFALSFPRENSALRRYPILGLVVFLPHIVHLALMMHGEGLIDALHDVARELNPERDLSVGAGALPVSGLDNVVTAIGRLFDKIHRRTFALVNVSYATVALAMLWSNRTHLVSPRIVRQVRLVWVGLVAAVSLYAATKIAGVIRPVAMEPLNNALISASLLLSGGTIAYAVVRHQFLGIRNVLRGGALYTAVAGIFAVLFVVLVRPLSVYFGQYGGASRDIFETSFVVLAVIAFQPTLSRVEELLGRIMLRGRNDAAQRFLALGEAVAATTTRDDLHAALRAGLREALDTSEVRLLARDDVHSVDATHDSSYGLAQLLVEIGEPVRRNELERLADAAERGDGGGWWRPWRRNAIGDPDPDAGDLPRAIRRTLSHADLAGTEVLVPILKGGTCAGCVAMGRKIYGVPYSSEELGHLAVLSTQLGVALDTIRLLSESLERKLLEEELKLARRIQTQLLPGAPPTLKGYELSAVSVPSRYVGGDYYDFVVVDGRWLVLVVADVSGKGIPASILTATLQATVRSNADAHVEPDVMLARLNRLLYRNTSPEEFATLFYAVVDLETGGMRYANAGHEHPLVALRDRVETLTEGGLVLGCFEDYEYLAASSELPIGASLVIYTDGITDTESSEGEPYGSARLTRLVAGLTETPAAGMCEQIIDDVRRYGTREGQDDLTLVVLRRTA